MRAAFVFTVADVATGCDASEDSAANCSAYETPLGPCRPPTGDGCSWLPPCNPPSWYETGPRDVGADVDTRADGDTGDDDATDAADVDVDVADVIDE